MNNHVENHLGKYKFKSSAHFKVGFFKLWVLNLLYTLWITSVQLLSPVWLWNPMDCSTPGFPVQHQLPACSNSRPSSQWCHPTILLSVVPFSSCLQSSPTSGSSPLSQFFASNGQNIIVKVKSESEVVQSCPTLCDPMDCSLPGSSVHEILQARILEWIAISFSRESSRPRDRTWVFCFGVRRFNLWATREAKVL